jgi:tripartite-type tricarboxylate transporter receptor subunit TctC
MFEARESCWSTARHGRRGMIRIAGALLLAVAAGGVTAQEYPTKPVRLVVAYPPGGSTDIAARMIGPRLQEILGQPVVIENRAGANGAIGTDHVAKSAPDGYTLLLTSISPLVVNPHTFAQGVPYDTVRDFVGITGIAANPSTLALHPSVPATNLKELFALSKDRDIALASSGEGGLPHLVIEMLRQASGGRVVHVPYKGGGPAATDAIAGHVQGVVVDLAALQTHIQAGRLRAVMVSSEQRNEFVPDVPTATEQGVSLVALSWMGVSAPANTPRPIVEKLHAALLQTMAQPQVKEGFAKMGLSVFTFPTPDAFQQFKKEEFDKWGKVARESGAKAK